ncbi:aldose epimerase family protein [Pseudozobellia thermophila]|uniref:Aldose 1-epimerase n=1 Tax=Pseudozobellia thermophila TaxID=192903 RepID=A0A1M6GFN9_9FLAO|nr:aldose epimerase family protein [Pseudozobellia thermophila]SHJ08775.1 aldose 1-epimerase [Pseudozobellia thermophila]
MRAYQTDFGLLDDQPVHAFTLENDKGMTVTVLNYGATVQSIRIPVGEGKPLEITCGFDSFETYFSREYTENAPYFGGTIGRYTSQIKDARFYLNDTLYQLAPNCGANNLHGGTKGFDKRLWKAKMGEGENSAYVQMKLKSGHLEEGFPGNVDVQVTFSLNNANRLTIDYWAKSDQETPFSMTNHAYFNLNGFEDTVEEHWVQIDSDKKQVWDSSGAATGEIVSLDGSPEDLRHEKRIGDVHKAMGDGFEHYYLFDHTMGELKEVASLRSPLTGISMKVATTEPGMLFYTGKYTSDELRRESGLPYGKYRGFCCETHRWPNGPNLKDAPKSFLKADEEFTSTTTFSFDW